MFRFRARVTPWESYRYAAPVKGAPQTVADLGKQRVESGRSEVIFHVKLNDPVTWAPEKPFLYHLQLHAAPCGILRDGEQELIGQARFGFREIKTDGSQFRLNGKRLYLPGHQPNEPYRSDVVLAANIEDWCVKYLQSMRDVNVRYVRLHSGHYPQPFYDAADEVGLLFCAERLLPGNYDDSPEFAASVKRLVDHYYNHPSVITYSLGNEHYSNIRPGTIEKSFPKSTKLYDLYKRWDKTRPITTCSGSSGVGRLKDEDLHKWPKTDYHDAHDYTAGGAYHYTQIPIKIRHYIAVHNRTNPGRTKPYVNGEGGFINPSHYKLFDALAKDQPNLDRALYAESIEKFFSETTKLRNKVHNSWVISLVGLGTLLDGPYAVRSDVFTHLLENYRIYGMEQVGFNLHSFNPYFTGKPEYMRHPPTAETAEFRQLVRKMMAPLFVTCDRLTRNAFAGKPLTFTLIAINDTMADLKDVTISMAVTDGEKVVVSDEKSITPFTQEHHHRFDILMELPARVKTGHYELVLTMKDPEGNSLAENSHRLHILGKEPTLKNVQARKVLVYVGQSAEGTALKRVLDALDVTYTEAEDLSELKECPVLIVGPNAFDAEVDQKIETIRHYVRDGGYLLVLCQSGLSITPVIEALRYRGFGPPSNTDVVTFEHPAFHGFDRMDFRLWNGKVFPTANGMTPMTPAVLAAVAQTYRAMNEMGMSVGEIALGKGVYMFSQLRAIENYERDSVAARYANQLLRYAVSKEWTTQYAVEVTGGAGIGKFKLPAPDSAFFVDLRPYCNMGFVDEVADDRKGGFADEGPTSDMRVIPLGRQTFAGVPFEIIDPAKNQGKSCIVLGGNVKKYFPERIEEIKIGCKASYLYFLVSPTYCAPRPGMKIGKVVFHYPWGGFGTTSEISFELEVDKNVVDWTQLSDNLPGAAVAFEAKHPNWDRSVGALMIPWENPVPEEKIESMDIISYGNTVPIFVAVTGTTGVKGGRAASLTPGYWKFDEGEGKVVHDTLGNHPAGTFHGKPEWEDGRSGRAIRLGGKTSAVTIERPQTKQALGGDPPSFSVSVWIKAAREQPTGSVGIISTFSERRPPYRGFGLHFRTNNRVYFALEKAESVCTPQSLNDDKWHHIVAVYDSKTRTPELWVDGKGPSRGHKTGFAPSSSPIRLGQYYSTIWAGSYAGLIDEVRIFDKTLNEEEIKRLATATMGP